MENDIRALVLTTLLSVAAAPRGRGAGRFPAGARHGYPDGRIARKFRTPPGEAGMSCYWWWLNGHTTEEAITRDLEEMKAKGYGSAALIDAGGFNPVTARPGPGEVFLLEGWKRLYRHAVREADRLGITLSVNATSGWNPGGPFVTPERALKRLTLLRDGRPGRRAGRGRTAAASHVVRLPGHLRTGRAESAGGSPDEGCGHSALVREGVLQRVGISGDFPARAAERGFRSRCWSRAAPRGGDSRHHPSLRRAETRMGRS